VDLDDEGRGSHGLSSDRSEPLTPGGLDSMWITRRKLKLEIKRSPLRTTSVVRLDTASEHALSMFGSNENTKATQTPQDIYIYIWTHLVIDNHARVTRNEAANLCRTVYVCLSWQMLWDVRHDTSAITTRPDADKHRALRTKNALTSTTCCKRDRFRPLRKKGGYYLLPFASARKKKNYTESIPPVPRQFHR
jgi:hypothetical protein